jgi:hypothetical protein
MHTSARPQRREILARSLPHIPRGFGYTSARSFPIVRADITDIYICISVYIVYIYKHYTILYIYIGILHAGLGTPPLRHPRSVVRTEGWDGRICRGVCGCTCMPSASRLHLILHTREFMPARTSRARRMLPLVRSVRSLGFGLGASDGVFVRSGLFFVCLFVCLGPLVICLCVLVWLCVRAQHARRGVRRRRGDFARETRSADHARPHPGACARVYYVGALVRVRVCVCACVRARVCVCACACVCVVQRYDACVSTPGYLLSSICCCFAFVQRYYAWLDKTAAYTRDTPAGHVSVRPWGYSQGYSQGTHGVLTGCSPSRRRSARWR